MPKTLVKQFDACSLPELKQKLQAFLQAEKLLPKDSLADIDLPLHPTIESETTVQDTINEYLRGWNCLKAIQVGDIRGAFEFSTEGIAIQNEIQKLRDLQAELRAAPRKKLQTLKSAYKICPNCSSKIHLATFLNTHEELTCPVCLKQELATLDTSKLNKLYHKIEELWLKRDKARTKYYGKNPIPYWLVVGWVTPKTPN